MEQTSNLMQRQQIRQALPDHRDVVVLAVRDLRMNLIISFMQAGSVTKIIFDSCTNYESALKTDCRNIN